MRLIDADKLKVDYIDYIVPSTVTNTPCYRYISEEQIDNVPTIDAVPVVRCKECKYFYGVASDTCQIMSTRLHFYEEDKNWTENGFCSWGERSEE